jgi:hypothetical protein
VALLAPLAGLMPAVPSARAGAASTADNAPPRSFASAFMRSTSRAFVSTSAYEPIRCADLLQSETVCTCMVLMLGIHAAGE